ncbi:Fic family protein [Peribacillus sp. NPDC096540]|uniref:Fic family protein n=1 Tax=Peribacillus sp. NPDC096540 TaxID=3390612 RepID=UPI003D05BE8D
MTVGGKTIREHLEGQTKNLHRQILKGIDDEYAGVYRNVKVFISGVQHTPPKPLKIQEEMDELMSWYVYKAHAIKDYEDFITLVAAELGFSLNLYLSAVNCS